MSSLSKPRSPAAGPLVALLGFAAYALHDVLVRILGETLHIAQVMFFMGLFSFPMLLLLLITNKTPGTLRAVHPVLASLRALTSVSAAGLGFYAFTVLPLAQVYAMLFATPLLITILSVPLLGERVGIWRGGAVVVGLIGVLVVLQPGAQAITLGHIAGIGSALSASLSAIIMRRISRDERPEVMVLFPMMAVFLVMGASLPWVYVPPSLSELSVLLLLSVLSFAAMLCILFAYRWAEAAVVAPMQYSQMLWAVFYGALLFDERPTAGTLWGAGIIIASGVFIVFRESRRNVSALQPVLHTRPRPGPDAMAPEPSEGPTTMPPPDREN